MALLMGVAGCAPVTGSAPPGPVPVTADAGATPPPAFAGETGAQCADGIDNDGNLATDCQDPSCGGSAYCGVAAPPPDFEACEALRAQADTTTIPVDIIWIVDGSTSMEEEGRFVQEHMNAFAASISASGIDYHVVVVWNPRRGLTVPPPLGGDDSRLRIVGADVNSDEGMSDLLEHFPQYRDFLRPNGITHFIHVTDDDSDMSWETFRERMEARLGHTFTSHAIVSPPNAGSCGGLPGLFACGCQGPYGQAFAPGEEYWNLASATGGRQLDICSSNWSDLFGRLQETIAIPIPVPCEFSLPAAPAGMVFDPDLVNVVYVPGGGGVEQTLPRVSGASACVAGRAGWYYDNPTAPTRVILCADGCNLLSADGAAVVQIAFGCEVELL